MTIGYWAALMSAVAVGVIVAELLTKAFIH